MNHDTFRTWLDTYGRAWETQDVTDAEDIYTVLFTERATYQVTPFDEPLSGRLAIIEYGSASLQSQEQLRFNYEILAVTSNVGIAHWRVSFVQLPAKKNVNLDGIFVVTFNEEGRCTEFREWWHSYHSEPEQEYS